MVFYSSQSIFFPFGIIFSLSFQKTRSAKGQYVRESYLSSQGSKRFSLSCFYYSRYVP